MVKIFLIYICVLNDDDVRGKWSSLCGNDILLCIVSSSSFSGNWNLFLNVCWEWLLCWCWCWCWWWCTWLRLRIDEILNRNGLVLVDVDVDVDVDVVVLQWNNLFNAHWKCLELNKKMKKFIQESRLVSGGCYKIHSKYWNDQLYVDSL